jgi:hypothetical protein
MNSKYPGSWKVNIYTHLRDETLIWCDSFNLSEIFKIIDEEYERIYLDKWSHGIENYTKSTKCLFSRDNFLLQVHGCIKQENVIISINPSSKHNFINVNRANRLQVPKNIFKVQRLRVRMFQF